MHEDFFYDFSYLINSIPRVPQGSKEMYNPKLSK